MAILRYAHPKQDIVLIDSRHAGGLSGARAGRGGTTGMVSGPLGLLWQAYLTPVLVHAFLLVTWIR